MQNPPKSPPIPKADYLIPAGLTVVALIPALAGTVRLVGLAQGGPITPANAHFFAQPLPVILHIIGAVLFCFVGAWQFSPGLRRRHLRWHKLVGRVVLPAGLFAAASGLWMALFYAIGLGAGTQAFTMLPWVIAFGLPAPMPYAILMGLAWVINLAVAEYFIRRTIRRPVARAIAV